MDLASADISRVLNDDDSYYICKVCIPTAPPDVLQQLAAESIHKRVFVPGFTAPTPTVTPVSSTVAVQQVAPQPAPLTNDQFEALLASMTKTVLTAATDLFNELFEKKEKRNNLVAFGIPETEVDPMKQATADRSRVNGYLATLGVPHSSVVSVFRDGAKKPGQSRILKICFGDRLVTERSLLLSHGTRLLQTDPTIPPGRFKPFIRPDLTAKQRQADFELREELKHRREAGEQNIVIRNGSIIQKPPRAPQGNSN
jgi:hypothetical protein